MIEFIKQPWPWYVAGPLIGLTVPALLIIGNKSFGISSSLRHICASCMPANIPFFKYDWKKEVWNLFFVFGIFLGGAIAINLLSNANPVEVNPKLATELAGYGITNFNNLVPEEHHKLAIIVYAKRFFANGCRWFFSGFRHTLRRWLHKRTRHYGIVQLTTSVIDCNY